MFDPTTAEPVHRPEDDELMGFIIQDKSQWNACTVFGYSLAAFASRQEARDYLLANGLAVLADDWQFRDSDDEWYKCGLIEAKPDHITARITDYGHPDVQKIFTIQNPDSTSVRYRSR